MNGTEQLSTTTVDSGNKTTYSGSTPAKDSTTKLVYTFNGWDKDISTLAITSDTTFNAQFTSSARKYTYNLC
ncbi:MAG: hypothetical protein H6689_01040 [Erysipelotrichaceae bacterium]|jgi:hypothetical protein|nr:hypothetical protein [Erysipelotrichaceae bacterium]MCB9500081.1 hypothetical protein [Erysipelotrichaceae bacterium]